MAKSKNKKGPAFDESALEKLTSRIDDSLAKGDQQKRKKPHTTEVSSQDRKRQRKSSDGASKQGKASSNENELLLAEIRALGGDEDDFDLIQNAESEDEVVGQDDKKHPIDRGLKAELAKLSKELGFAEYEPSEASEPEVEEEEEEGEDIDDGDEDGSDFDDEDVDEEEPKAVESKTNGKEKPEAQTKQQARKIGNLIFEPRADWHAADLPKLPGPSSDQVSAYSGVMESLKEHAKSLLEKDAVQYRTSIFASSSHKFLSTIMSSGTLTDKVSALTLAIQESPVHNIRAFEALLTLASKKSRAQAIGAIGALVDLLGPGALLPSDRRLRYFATQPELIGALQSNLIKSWKYGQKLPGNVTDAHLIAWAYEDWLKGTYFKLIQLLETWCSDEIEYSRSRALDFVYGLLKDKPEQESNLLRLLVNKLGDRDRKIASRASYLLLQLQTSHPGMKAIIVRTIEQGVLLDRSQDHRTKYYAINTLNQTILSSKDPAVAEALIRIYFDLFVTLLKAGSLGIGIAAERAGAEDDAVKASEKKPTSNPSGKPSGKPPGKPPGKLPGKSSTSNSSEQEVEAADKLVSAILTGVNRAAPFVSANEAIMENHLDTLFKIAHSANFNTGIQALLLIQHLSSSRNVGTDRFYRTLYESLLDPRLITSSKHSLYLNLMLRALKNDVDVRRVKAFAKRMLQVASLHQPPFVCGLLYVLAHLRETFPDLQTLIQDPEESVFDDEPVDQRPRYDGRKRDPEHSNAQRSCLWEMVPIQSHFHPSVAVFAAALADKDQKTQKPDLDSHSLIRFLDKFVYRNPKAADSTRGTSIMQPLHTTKDTGDIWLGSSRATGTTTSAINSAAFWNKKQENVAAEDVFFHEYFQQTAKESKRQTKASRAADEDEDGDEQEDEIWKALVSTQPEIDGHGDDSEGFDDLDDAEMASDDDDDDDIPLDLDDEDDISDDDMVDIEGDSDEGEELIAGAVATADGDDSEDAEGGEAKKEKDERRERRKKLRALPTFASVDDYAELLGQDEDEQFD